MRRVPVVRGASMLAAALTLGLLTACGATIPDLDPDPTQAAPSSETTQTPTPTASSAPPFVQGPEPVSVLPLDCADILSLGSVQDEFSTTVQVRVDETRTPASSVEFVQAGGLECTWGGANQTNSSYDEGISLRIVGDASAEFSTWAATKPLGSGAVKDTIGDRSLLRCDVSDDAYRCGAVFLVGEYWVEATTGDSVAVSSTKAVATATDLLQEVASAISAAGPARPAWEPPASAFRGEPLCYDPTYPAEALLAGYDGWKVKASIFSGSDQNSVMLRRADVVACKWTLGVSGVSFSTIPGGGWAFDRIIEQGMPLDAFHPPAEVIDTPDSPGVDGAAVSCGDGCMAIYQLGDSLVTLRWVDINEEESAKLYAAMVAVQIAKLV